MFIYIFPKDNYKQKQCDTLPVRMIVEIICILTNYYRDCRGISV